MIPENKEIHRLIINRLVASTVILLLSLSALAGNSDFRRRAHNATNFNQVSKGDVQAEIRFGRSVAARILGRLKLSKDPSLGRYVDLVGQTLARNATRSELTYHFAVVESEAVNAYSAPGGYIFVTTGALRLMRDEAELAAVLAHEIAHITQRHIVKDLNIRGAEQSTTSDLAKLMGGSADTLKVAFMQSVDKAVSILFESGYKRADESDADANAVMLLALTGYDPQALKRYIHRVSKHLQSSTPQKHVSHPPTRQRIDALTRYIRDNDLSGTGLPDMKKRFFQHVRFQ